MRTHSYNHIVPRTAHPCAGSASPVLLIVFLALACALLAFEIWAAQGWARANDPILAPAARAKRHAPSLRHDPRHPRPMARTHNVLPPGLVDQLRLDPPMTPMDFGTQKRSLDALFYTAEDIGVTPPTFAVPIATNVRPGTPVLDPLTGEVAVEADDAPTVYDADTVHGTWERLDQDTLLWRLGVASYGAYSLNFGFSRYRMPEGGSLIIYAPDDPDTVLGPYTHEDNEAHGELWTPLLPGSEAVIEVAVPTDRAADLQLELASVNYDYKNLPAMDLDKSGACNVDVICSQGDDWRDQISSVARIIISGQYYCTGALVNTASNDATPLFLTADHCGVTSTTASSVVFYWNFENSTCRTPGSTASGTDGDGDTSQTNTGAIFRATYDDSDMTLVELDDPLDPDHALFYAGWDRTDSAPANATAIHHPSGDEKRISFETSAPTITTYGGSSSPGDSTHLRIADWDQGTTEGGSSGSPLFDEDQRVVGQLHGGEAACGNDLPDWYGRLYTSWTGGGSSSTRLSDWLDPDETDATTADGQDAPRCTGAIDDFTNGYAESGGTGSFGLTMAASDCAWTASTNSSWISMTTGSGTGNGNVAYSVAAYDGTGSRQGTIEVAGRTHTVNQYKASTNLKLFWHNQTNGIVARWALDNAGARSDSGTISDQTLSTSWQMKGVGDIDQDGASDIIWHNQDNGKVAYWLVDENGTRTDSGLVQSNTMSTSWQIKGMADINNDQTSDLFWHNQSNGNVAYWLLNSDGSKASSGLVSSNTLSNNWKLRGVGDVDRDGAPDLLWHNQSNGNVAFWLVDANSTLKDTGLVSSTTLSSNWAMKGVGDIDQDGSVDLIWHNQDNGNVAYWLLNSDGSKGTSGLVSSNTLSSSWNLKGISDIDDDGSVDLVWHNQTNGKVAYWLVDSNSTVTDAGTVSTNTLSSSWQIKGVGY